LLLATPHYHVVIVSQGITVYYAIIKFNINEKKFKYKNARPSVSSLTVSSPTDSRQPDSRTNHPQTKSIIARAQILIDLNQKKFDEEFDIYKIKEDNKRFLRTKNHFMIAPFVVYFVM
jgi:hypothetical protein